MLFAAREGSENCLPVDRSVVYVNKEEPSMATVDDVFNLLKAVNETTLGRMENEIKDIRKHLH